jgi:hypothetical protein
MVHTRIGRSAVPVVIGIGVAVTACSSAATTVKPAVTAQSASATASASPTASPSGSGSAGFGSAGAVPAGDTRIGGAAQGISLAAPTSWVTLNPTKASLTAAADKAGVRGLSAATLIQDMASIQKLHGVIVFDVKSAVDSPEHFVPNLNAYCSASGVTDVGAAGVPLIKSAAAAEFAKLGATHIVSQQLEVGGMTGVETTYQLDSPSEGTIYGSQLEVLPAQNKICFVTVTVGQGESDDGVVSTAAATAQFP